MMNAIGEKTSNGSLTNGFVSDSDKQRADELKMAANAAFQENKFTRAVDLYTEAIESNPYNAILWANRAFAHTKLEEYGSAVEDANKAIELDPKYIKGYYRRGSAHLAMGKFKDALKDFRLASKSSPHDVDAKKKVKECKDAAFRDAISNPDVAEAITRVEVDYTNIEVEDSYEGARIEGDEVTLNFVMKMVEDFRNQKTLHKRYAFQLLYQVKDLLSSLPSLVEIEISDNSGFTVCGDIHGQFYDLLNIFEINGYPSDDNPYLFNGDFVDRGSFSVECIFTLFAFKCLYPNGLYLSRGNHESRGMNKIYGFDGEVKSKFNLAMVDLFAEVFCCLPLSHVLNKKIFIVHGGLFSTDNVKLDDIKSINRFCEPPDEGLMCELLWSDPHPGEGRLPSKRGVGIAFGSDVTEKFLKLNNLELVIRSHEVKDEGFEEDHEGKLFTVFSAPNYCDQMGNKGAFIKFQAPEMKPKVTKFSAVPHPSVRPMAYANFLSLLS